MPLTLDPALKKTLGDKLLECEIFKTPDNRQVVLNNLPYGKKVSSSPRPDVHAQNVIEIALGERRGLDMLLDMVYRFEGDTSDAMQDVFQMLDLALPQPISWWRVTQLKEMLKAERFDGELLERLCVENSPQAPGLPDGVEGHQLLCTCVEVLARWPYPSPEDAPLLAFLYALLPSVRDSKTSDGCARWMDAVAPELGADLNAIQAKVRRGAEAAPAAEPSVPYMLVTVQANEFDPDNEILIKGWLYHGGGYKPLNVEPGPHARDKLPLLMRQLIFDSQNKLLKEAGRPVAEASRLVIELFLPVDLLGSEIDQWGVKLGKFAAASPLERHFPVVVRSYERVYDEEVRAFSWGRWQEKWNSRPVLPHMLTQEEVYLASAPTDYTGTLFERLAQANLFFLGLTLIPPPGVDLNAAHIFGQMIEAGMPAAIWLRRCGADMRAVRAALEDLIYKNCLDSIPTLIYEKRRELWDDDTSSVWKAVSLLWDDPDRLPPDALAPAGLQAPKALEE